MIPVCFPELSIFTFHQNTQSTRGQRMMSVTVSANTELSVRPVIFTAVHFLYSSSTSLSSPKSGWLQLDWTLYKRNVICAVKGLFVMTWHGLDIAWIANIWHHPARDTCSVNKKASSTPDYHKPSMSCLAWFRKSLSKSWHAETLHGSKTYNLQYLHSLLSSWM